MSSLLAMITNKLGNLVIKNCQSKRSLLIANVIVAMVFFLITGVVTSSAEGSKVTRGTPDLSGSINLDNPNVNPGDDSSEYDCPPSSTKCSCSGANDCFLMERIGYAKVEHLRKTETGEQHAQEKPNLFFIVINRCLQYQEFA